MTSLSYVLIKIPHFFKEKALLNFSVSDLLGLLQTNCKYSEGSIPAAGGEKIPSQAERIFTRKPNEVSILPYTEQQCFTSNSI